MTKVAFDKLASVPFKNQKHLLIAESALDHFIKPILWLCWSYLCFLKPAF